jgi:hypothetical protein
MKRNGRPSLGLFLLWISAGCLGSNPSHAPPVRPGEPAPSDLAYYGDTSTVELPTSTKVGEVVTLRFTTFGGGCISPGLVDVEISGLRAEVRPYLEKPPAEQPDTVVCTADLRMDSRVAHLRFERPGEATVRIIGHASPEDRPVVLERRLRVNP